MEGINVAPCATTGIAAELLFEGSTVHRRFGPIPSPLNSETASRPIQNYESQRSAIMRAADVIIIDEASSLNIHLLNYLDALLKSLDVPFGDIPFGGKVLI
jgi:hypothetical protein